MKQWGVFLIGGGLGLTIGAGAGESAAVTGLVVAVLGLVLRLAAGRARSRDLVGDALAAGDARAGRGATAAVPWGPDDRPSFAHLGTRVEQVLSLAEEQAADHIAEAKIEADRILADARAEAARITPTPPNDPDPRP